MENKDMNLSNGKKISESQKIVISEKDKIKPQRVSAKISLIYMLVGSLWILMSDKLVALLVAEREAITEISIIKGWLYVAITGLLVYSLVKSSLEKLKSTEDKLYVNYQNLIDTNLELAAAYYTAAESQNEFRLQCEKLVENQKRLQDS
ncbi:MAG: hypothetical protein ACM3ZR_01720, partial [Pseudomonadota bacterium]